MRISRFKKEDIYEVAKTTVTSVAKRAWVAGKSAVLSRINRRKSKEEAVTNKLRFDEMTEEATEPQMEKKKSEVVYSYKMPK